MADSDNEKNPGPNLSKNKILVLTLIFLILSGGIYYLLFLVDEEEGYFQPLPEEEVYLENQELEEEDPDLTPSPPVIEELITEYEEIESRDDIEAAVEAGLLDEAILDELDYNIVDELDFEEGSLTDTGAEEDTEEILRDDDIIIEMDEEEISPEELTEEVFGPFDEWEIEMPNLQENNDESEKFEGQEDQEENNNPSFPKQSDSRSSDNVEEDDEVMVPDLPSGLSLDDKNLLLLGFDDYSSSSEAAAEYNIDFIMLVLFEADNIKISLKSILPAQSYQDKELRKYELSNILQAITDLTGYDIDYYATSSFDSFAEIINTAGGIIISRETDFLVPELDLKLTTGNNKLNGRQALNYIRYYNSDNGEIDRIHRQQEVVHALIERFSSLENLIQLPRIYETLKSDYDLFMTDIDRELIRNAVRFARVNHQLSLDFIVFER